MSKRKVVTLCGSVRFWDKIQEMYEKLELENEYYVGKSTRQEIEYAKQKGKEIIYLENI